MKNYNTISSSNDEYNATNDCEMQQDNGINMFCLIGMILSIMGALSLFLIPVLGILLAVAGIILSAVGLRECRINCVTKPSTTMAKAGIIVPCVSLALYVLLIVGTIAFTLSTYNNLIGSSIERMEESNNINDDESVTTTMFRNLLDEYAEDTGLNGINN